MEDIAGFLAAHPPFDAVDAGELARVAAVTEIEDFPAGKTIFSQGTGPVGYLRIVRAGSVEIIYDGQVLDLLGPGELFGHASMLSGLPTGFEARAAEDTLCYRIPADVIGPLLARPDFLRFIARSIVGGRTGGGERVPPADPVQRPVETLIRTPPLVCSRRRANPRSGQTDDRRPRERDPGPIRRDARHRDGLRPALARRRSGRQSRYARLRHHERARLHRGGRAAWSATSCWTCLSAACITFPCCPPPARSWAWWTAAT